MSQSQAIVIPDHSAEIQQIMQDLRELRAMMEKVVITPRPEYLTVKEYAKFIGKSERTVMRRIEAGKIAVTHVGGERMIRVS